MLKKRSAYERLISLLQGASWALVVVGATVFSSILYPFGLFSALIGAFLGSLGGLFFVIVFEIAHQQSEKLEEIKKQTKLLEKIDEKLSNN
jgi:purine-cytosine permease-like protein